MIRALQPSVRGLHRLLADQFVQPKGVCREQIGHVSNWVAPTRPSAIDPVLITFLVISPSSHMYLTLQSLLHLSPPTHSADFSHISIFLTLKQILFWNLGSKWDQFPAHISHCSPYKHLPDGPVSSLLQLRVGPSPVFTLRTDDDC